MWLLNVVTLVLEHFQDDRLVKGQYAILSHTWGEEELSFDTIHLDLARSKRGYRKIVYACRQAVADGLKYAWVDTCCIDKRSSTELSEAINSMYRWYYNARICYAYLSDVSSADDVLTERGLRSCRWFTRGWTLQELIAPPRLLFYNSDWEMLASRADIAEVLANITHVDQGVLEDRDELWQTSVAKRMSWASMRNTTREEDLAYSLLGIFDINMPLLYGEGSKAFKRLQEEIIRTWTRVDHSILAWDGKSEGLLAISPAQFPVHFPEILGRVDQDGRPAKRDIVSWSPLQNDTFELSNKGLRITLFARAINGNFGDQIIQSQAQQEGARGLDLGAEQSKRLLVALNCTYGSAKDMLFAMYLNRRPWINYGPHRPMHMNQHDYAMYDFEAGYTAIKASRLSSFTMTTLTIARTNFVWPLNPTIQINWRSTSYDIKATLPTEAWQERDGKLLQCRERRPVNPQELPHLSIGRHNLESSMLVLFVRPCMESRVPVLRLDWSGTFAESQSRKIENGEPYALDFGRQDVLVLIAELFFVAETTVWNLSVSDPACGTDEMNSFYKGIEGPAY
tara:strand:+ start:158 stop:1858 length:1701 start_codon:yes stop_codon:yes gene_type:complete